MKLKQFIALACHYAQDYCYFDNTTTADRSYLLESVSYQVACFLAQNTKLGGDGVDWDVVLKDLAEAPIKSVKQWEEIIEGKANELGGWKQSVSFANTN